MNTLIEESYSTESDSILVKRLKMGQIGAFNLLYERYSQNLYNFSMSLLKTHEDAEGVVQEVFYRVWNKRYELQEQKSFKSFLFVLAYNMTIDHFRKRAKDHKYEAFNKRSKIRNSIAIQTRSISDRNIN